MIKKHNIRSKKKKYDQIASELLGPSSENNVNLLSWPKKLQKISQSEQALETESEKHSSQLSEDTESSISFNLSQKQSETTGMSSQSKAYWQITLEQSLKVPKIEILINNADKFTNKKPSASWVWGYMKKDKLKMKSHVM